MTNDCSKKGKLTEVKCYNCEENHPANYKGCEVYKQLQQKLYPKLRLKKQIEQSENFNSIQQKQHPNIATARQIQPNTSNNTYAQITKRISNLLNIKRATKITIIITYNN
jgi:hypothetical protein